MKISELPVADKTTAADNTPIEIPVTVNGSTYKAGNEFLGKSIGGICGAVDNCNDMTNGFGFIGATTKNSPFSYGVIISAGTLYHGTDSGDWRGQLAIGSSGDVVFVRGYSNGQWSPWKKIVLE